MPGYEILEKFYDTLVGSLNNYYLLIRIGKVN